MVEVLPSGMWRFLSASEKGAKKRAANSGPRHGGKMEMKQMSKDSKKSKGGGGRQMKPIVIRGLDVAFTGAMLDDLNRSAVYSPENTVFAAVKEVALKKRKAVDGVGLAARRLIDNAKENAWSMGFKGASYYLLRRALPSRTVKVPGVPVRVGV